MKTHAPIILTGMHRSGTSLIAGYLHRSGINMGESLVEADAGNPNGYHEDCSFVEFQTEILRRRHKSAWYAPKPISNDAAMIESARTLLESRGSAAPWGWKDPRTCLFLELWQAVAPDAKFVFVFRNPFAVMDSLHRRENEASLHWRARAQWLSGWLIHTRACANFAATNPNQCFMFELEDFTQNPDILIPRLNHFLGLNLNAVSFKESFKRKELRPAPMLLRELLRLPQHISIQCYIYYRKLCGIHHSENGQYSTIESVQTSA